MDNEEADNLKIVSTLEVILGECGAATGEEAFDALFLGLSDDALNRAIHQLAIGAHIAPVLRLGVERVDAGAINLSRGRGELLVHVQALFGLKVIEHDGARLGDIDEVERGERVAVADFVSKIDLTRSIPSVDDVFDGHHQHVSNALAGSAPEFLKVLPGKACLALLCEKFGVSRERYINLITQALSQPDVDGDPALEALRLNLIAALGPLLPPRA